MTPETLQEREEISELLKSRQLDEAYVRLSQILEDDPNDWNAIYLMGSCMQQSDKSAIAYQLFKRAALKRPDVREIWNNLGASCDTLQRFEEAVTYYDQAIQMSPDYADAMGNRACALINLSKFDEALDQCDAGLVIEPGNERCLSNRAYALLALGHWGTGWEHYDYLLGDGSHNRKAWDYGVPQWRGEPGAGLVVYGEQGLGDELMFASCIPDLRDVVDTLVIECDKRIAPILQRSFPWAHVYGNRHDVQTVWKAPHKITHQCAIGSLPRYTRLDLPSFERGAGVYLRADPERIAQCMALMDGARPNIGIAWSGGRHNTGAKFRYISPQLLAPLFDAIDAKWWSLEYKDPDNTIAETPVRHVSRILEATDYDETAAFVSCLDLVITVPTTVANLAGAMDVETWLLRPAVYNWRWHPTPNPWHKSIKRTFEQQHLFQWSEVISEVANALRSRFPESVHRGGQPSPARLHGVPVQHNSSFLGSSRDHSPDAAPVADNPARADRVHF